VKTLFLSCQDIDDSSAQSFIQALKSLGFATEHSPSNPIRGIDKRWNAWYSTELLNTLSKVNAFIVLLDNGWDSSTWMAIEGEAALGLAQPLPMYVYNPLEIKVSAKVMLPYLKELLPSDPAQAAEYLADKIL
jgi:hypothetical protein